MNVPTYLNMYLSDIDRIDGDIREEDIRNRDPEAELLSGIICRCDSVEIGCGDCMRTGMCMDGWCVP